MYRRTGRLIVNWDRNSSTIYNITGVNFGITKHENSSQKQEELNEDNTLAATDVAPGSYILAYLEGTASACSYRDSALNQLRHYGLSYITTVVCPDFPTFPARRMMITTHEARKRTHR